MTADPASRVDVFRIPTRIFFGRGVALTVAEPLRQVGAKTAADIDALYRAAL